MKKLLSVILALTISLGSMSVNIFAKSVDEDMRAVWMATVYNLDFPSTGSMGNPALQKAEIDSKMAAYKDAGLNTVIFQVRPKNDALYMSNLNPWSSVLTGVEVKYPGYDPLEYAISAAHKNGLELHAWLNPYRVTTSGTDVSVLPNGSVAKENPSWVLEHNNALFLNPARVEVQNFISDTVKEILINYDVDGIHFDDYFYPSNYPLTEGNGNGAEANQRRENVNNLIRKVGQVVDTYGNGAVFGVSPLGIYKNVEGSIRGSESYYSVYADTLTWVENGWVDYITPQVYWETTHSTAAYENVVKWWNTQLQGSNVKLYIGEGIYKDAVAKEIKLHLDICEKYENVSGNFYYSSNALLSNKENCFNVLKDIYKNKDTLTPDKPIVVAPNAPPTEIKYVEALPTRSIVLVDGIDKPFEAYNIGGYNFFKLRDIAYVINNSDKQFNTIWEESKQAITLDIGNPYVVAGGELKTSNNLNPKQAVTSTARLYLNNNIVSCEAYNIDDNNYYKLRDIATIIDFGVTWSESQNTVGIITFIPYSE